MTETTLPKLEDLEYISGETVPYPPTPALAAAQEALTSDGDTFELADGRSLRLRISHDEGASINDYESDGRIEWTRDNDYGHVRPADFDGSARVIQTDGGSALWWNPPGKEITGKGWDAETMQTEEARIRDLIEYGFSYVSLELLETVTDSQGGEHIVTVAEGGLGGVDEMYPALVAELLSEIRDGLDG